jgi:tetratricopeptide (TPR) repeat protein
VVELSQDLRRYLDGLPVKARPATFFYRSGKWIRRHGIAVTVGALAAALILAFAGVAWVEARNAQRRFDEVRSLAHSVIFDLHDAIAPLPGSTAARNLLIARALEYLERLSKDAGNDPKLAWEVALAYERIGIVQGFAPESNLGNGAAALESFKKSVAILSKLSASASYTRQLQRDYIRVLNHLAFSYGHNADYQSERETAQKCVAIAEGFLASHPGDPLAIADLANGLGTLADSLTDQKQYAEAALLRERVLALTLENEKAQPANPERRRNLALAYKKLAALYGVLHRYEDSRRSYEEARKIDEARLQAHPGDRAASMDLSFDYSDLGWVSSRLEDEPAALESHLKALELRQQAAKSDPNDARAASAVATSTSRIANTYQRLGDLDRAMDWFKRAIALRTAARDSRASDPGASSELARARQDLGELYEEMAQKKHRPEALASAASEYAQALSLYSDLRARGKLAKVDSEKIDELSGQLARVRAAR